jgi:rRNA-processing protein FCF1
MAEEQEDLEYQRDLQIRTINQLRESNETLTVEVEKQAKAVAQAREEKHDVESFAQDCVQRVKLAMKNVEEKNAAANAMILDLKNELRRLKQLPSIFLPDSVMEEIDSLAAKDVGEAPVLLRTRG